MIEFDKILKNPTAYRLAVQAKGISLDIDQLIDTGKAQKRTKQHVDELRAERNRLTQLVAAGIDRDANIQTARQVGDSLSACELQLRALDEEYFRLMSLVPGLPAPEVPSGVTDLDNAEISRWGDPTRFAFPIRDHIELAKLHNMINLKGAREIAGSRAYALTGDGALLEIALLQFALLHLVNKGFTAVLPPLLVDRSAMFGTGYFPLGEDNVYQLEKDSLFLTGTSEVGTVAIHKNEIFDARELPLRYAGISPCFRREAGSAGRDTKGLYRVHQFQKVEQVVFCPNDAAISQTEHFALLKNAEEIVRALEMPYRIVAVCTGDMGLGQVRKHDIETWMPSRNAYCETHSCSTFHDFQSRRLRIRYRDEDGNVNYVHTLNNTAIASPRILVAFLENHQNEDGSINIPLALRPFLNNRRRLEPSKY